MDGREVSLAVTEISAVPAQNPHMDALTADIARVESLDTGKKLVHLIDREGDSIGHMRTLSAQGICWLVRGKEGHRAEWGGDTRKIGEIADDLPFIANVQVAWKGKKTNMEIGKTSVGHLEKPRHLHF